MKMKEERRRSLSHEVPDRRRAEVGEEVIIGGVLVGRVQPKVEGSKGRWVCISCGVPLMHNLDADLHCQGKRARGTSSRPGGKHCEGAEARHVLAWLSFETGNYEVP